MVARFNETLNIVQQNLSTGDASEIGSLSSRLKNFSGHQFRVGAQKIRENVKFSFVHGEAQFDKTKPISEQNRPVPVLFGQAAMAFNKGLQAAYIAGIDNDNRLEVARIAEENSDNLSSFNDSVNSYRDTLLKEVDPASVDAVARSLDQQILTARLRVQGETIKRQKREVQESLSLNADSASDASSRLARNGDAVGAAQELNKAIASVDSMDISDDEKASLKRDMERTSSEQVIMHDLDIAFDEGGSDQAFEEIESLSKKVPNGWTPKEWNTFIGSAQAEINQKLTIQAKANAEEQIAVSRDISNLKIAAKTGAGDAGEIVRKTEKFFDDGEINEAERTSIFTNLIKGQKTQRDIAFDDSQVSKKISGDASIVLDQKQIDGFYDRVLAPELDNMAPEEREVKLSEVADSLKQVPTRMKNSIINGLRSDDPDLIIESSSIIDRIDSVRGLVDRDFSATDRAFGRLVKDLSINMDPSEAVKLAREQTNPNDSARVQARQSQIKELVKDSPDIYSDAVESQFSPFFGSNLLDQANMPAITKEYQTLFDAHFTAGMDENNARQKSLQILERNWGESSVTGKSRAMKYRPEDYYSVSGESDYIGDQLLSDVKSQFLLSDDFSKEDLILIGTNSHTARTASSGQPEYLVGINMKDKGLIFLNGFNWKPDMQAQIEKVTKASQDRVNELRSSDSMPDIPSIPGF